MSVAGFRRLAEREVHQGYVWRLVTTSFAAPDGQEFARDIVRSPGAVGVVAVTHSADGTPNVVLVHQWRAAYETELWEIPAGMRDVPGELPETTARRELEEEVGLRASALVPLFDMYPSPGLTDSVTTLFLTIDPSPTDRDVHGPEEEHMTVAEIPLGEAIEMVERGEVRDAKTVVGLLLTARRLGCDDTG